MVDTDTTDAVAITLALFNEATMTSDAAAVVTALFYPAKRQSRTFLDLSTQDPLYSVSFKANGTDVDSISLFSSVNGEIIYVDSYGAVSGLTITSDGVAARIADLTSPPNGILDDVRERLTTGIQSRTFMNADQDPTLSMTINEADEVSGISKFNIAGGDIEYVDSHVMVDTDTTDAAAITLALFDEATMLSDAAAVVTGLFDPAKRQSRTFLDLSTQDPLYSVSFKANGTDVDSISLFSSVNGEIIYVDSYGAVSGLTITSDGVAARIADLTSPPNGILDDVRERLTTGIQSRTFLNADQDPTLSMTVNEAGEVSGISKFNITGGDIEYVDSHVMVDTDTADAVAITLALFDEATMTSDAAAVVTALFYPAKRQSRTFLDLSTQDPLYSVSFKTNGTDVDSISLFSSVNGEIIYVDSYGAVPGLTITSDGVAARIADLTSPPNGILDDVRERLTTSIQSRTFMNADQDPTLSMTVNEAGEVSGISKFNIAGGDIEYVDSHVMVDTDTADAVAITLALFDEAAMLSDAAAVVTALFDPAKRQSRTFLDLSTQDPLYSVSFKTNGTDVDSISLFSSVNGEIIYVDSYGAVPCLTITSDGVAARIADLTSPPNGILDDVRERLTTSIQSRTFLNADQDPTLSMTVNEAGEVSGISKFNIVGGDIEYVDSHVMVDTDTTDAVAITLALFDEAAMLSDAVAVVTALFDPAKRQSRTFLDLSTQDPLYSVSFKTNGTDVDSISLFSSVNGEIIYVDSYGAVPGLTITSDGVAARIADLTSPPNGILDDVRERLTTSIQSRTFLNADQDPTLSMTINEAGEVSGISKFNIVGGDIEYVDSHVMVDTDTTDAVAITLALFDEAAML